MVWAGVFALLVIGTAVGTYFFEHGKNGGLSLTAANDANDADHDGLTTWEELAWHTDPNKYDTDGDGASDGAEVAAGTDPLTAGSAPNAYEAANGPSTQLMQNLAQATVSLGSNPTDAEISAAAKSVAQSGALPDLNERIAIDALRISDTEPTNLYAEITYRILATATAARQNELTLFRQAVMSQNYYGTPALKDTAKQYKAIEGALIAMEVPKKFAAQHLEVVNAVGTLANIDAAMGNWSGDPFAGLAYLNAFSDARTRAETSIGALFDTISTDTAQNSK